MFHRKSNPTVEAPATSPGKIACPSCQDRIKATETMCPACGYHLVPPDSTATGMGQVLMAMQAEATSTGAAAPPSPTTGEANATSAPTTLPGLLPTRRVERKQPVQLSVALTVDRTASSQPFQVGVRKTAEMVLADLNQKAASVQVWVQTHGDEDEGQQPMLLCDGASVSQALQDISGINYDGGGVPLEHHLDAIARLDQQVPWGGDPVTSRNALILICTAESKPLTSGECPTDLGRRLRDKGILLYAVAEVTPRIYELVRAAEGFLVPISNEPDPAVMSRLGAKLAASIMAPQAGGGTIQMPA